MRRQGNVEEGFGKARRKVAHACMRWRIEY